MNQSYQKQFLQNILFIDIETVSCVDRYEALTTPMQELWDKKAATIRRYESETFQNLFFDRAPIYAEFGKVIVIGLGYISFVEGDLPILRVKSLRGHDEKALLHDFKNLLETHFPSSALQLCAHNGKEFDFPYLCRRMVVNGIPLPSVLNVAGKKPWEVRHLDTMEMWKFGDRKSFTSLHLLATLLGITSSKEIMNGSEVNHYYYHKKELDKIADYCAQDVVVAAQLFLRLNFWNPLPPERIVLVEVDGAIGV
ncbi:MAG: 3'-5' exonuclease [Bacteroidota bacterium]